MLQYLRKQRIQYKKRSSRNLQDDGKIESMGLIVAGHETHQTVLEHEHILVLGFPLFVENEGWIGDMYIDNYANKNRTTINKRNKSNKKGNIIIVSHMTQL